VSGSARTDHPFLIDEAVWSLQMEENRSEARPRGFKLVMLLAACVLLIGAAAFLLNWNRQPVEEPLEAEISIGIVRVTKGKQESVPVESPGALPIRAGDRMHLDISYNQSAHTFLVWLDSSGKITPLYPWNMDNVEITDANAPPPKCNASKSIVSPMTIGNTWVFAKGSGLETVLLLARRKPLEADVKLQTVLGDLPPAKLQDPGELAILGLDRGAPSLATINAIKRGPVEEARARDQQLLAQLEKLRDEFEVMRVVRFAHEDK